MFKPSILARGAGSIATILVSNKPSDTARAKNRVEWPEPTSIMYFGACWRTIAYAIAASSGGNQVWFHRG